LKIKRLIKIFSVFQCAEKKYIKKKPDHYLARFLHAVASFFLYISSLLKKLKKLRKKVDQVFDFQRFEAFSVSFSVAFQ